MVETGGVQLATETFGSARDPAILLIMGATTDGLIKIVLMVGLYIFIFIGNSGIVSFGHIGFAGIAAYFATWMTCCAMMKPIIMTRLPDFLRLETYTLWPRALVSVAAAGLAALFIFRAVYANWDSVTMGRASVVGIPTYVSVWVALGAALVIVVHGSTRFRALALPPVPRAMTRLPRKPRASRFTGSD